MANPEHLAVLHNAMKHEWIYDTSEEWNRWILPRLKIGRTPDEFVLHPPVDLSGADLHGCNLSHLYLDGVNFEGADLRDAKLHMSKLRCVNLQEAHMERTWLNRAVFSKANLRSAHLEDALVMATDLAEADLRYSHLQGANLARAVLLKTKLQGANLTGANVYGVSVWDIEFDERTVQLNLVITHHEAAPVVTVDNLEVAQFIYLLMENQRLQKVIDTIASKVVWILGRFADPYKQVLDAIRQELRKRDFTPVLFDFGKPSTRSITTTMTALAHMAKFIIADITDPKSVPQELTEVTHALPKIPIQPILQADAEEWSMFPDLKDRGVVLRTLRYANVQDVRNKLIDAALASVDHVLRATESEASVAAMAEKLAALSVQLQAKEKRLAELEEHIRTSTTATKRRTKASGKS